MVMTRRASLLERQHSQSVALSEEPKIEVEVDVKPQIVPRDSPTLLRPTPQPRETSPVDVDDDEVIQALAAITIHDEPVDNDQKDFALTAVVEPFTASSITSTFDFTFLRTVVKTEVIEYDSEEEEEAKDTVGAMRCLVAIAVPGRGRGRASSTGSVVSVEDAKCSIDDFMTNRETFTADEDNKLRFWQSLCIEFRLVQVEIDPLPSFDQLSLGMTKSMRKRFNKKINKNKSLPPIPTSCTQAQKLLKAKAHVNLVDYFAARQIPIAAGEDRNYTKLLFPSHEAMVEYTRTNKKFVPRGDAKDEWLQPLLKTMRKNARV